MEKSCKNKTHFDFNFQIEDVLKVVWNTVVSLPSSSDVGSFPLSLQLCPIHSFLTDDDGDGGGCKRQTVVRRPTARFNERAKEEEEETNGAPTTDILVEDHESKISVYLKQPWKSSVS